MKTRCLVLLCLSALLAASSTHFVLAQEASTSAAQSSDHISIDNMCRVVTFDTSNIAHPKPHYKSDATICRIESPKETSTWLKRNVNGQMKNVPVDIREKEYVLQNPYDHAVTFHVHHPVPKNYHIDSEVQPNELVNSIAVFYVIVQPHESVRLHVGMSN